MGAIRGMLYPAAWSCHRVSKQAAGSRQNFPVLNGAQGASYTFQCSFTTSGVMAHDIGCRPPISIAQGCRTSALSRSALQWYPCNFELGFASEVPSFLGNEGGPVLTLAYPFLHALPNSQGLAPMVRYKSNA